MVHIILVILAIVITLVTIVATLYLGGPTQAENKAKADYARNQSSAAQIEAAMQLYYQDNFKRPVGEDMTLLNNLKGWGYLREIPAGDWKVNSLSLYKPIEIQDIGQCAAMNKAAGFNINMVPSQYQGCPPCNGISGTQQLTDAQTYKKWPGCQFIN